MSQLQKVWLLAFGFFVALSAVCCLWCPATAADMVIRVKGRRREQFLKALAMYSENHDLGKYEIAHKVIELMPAKDGDGYPEWRNLYNYMHDMDERYGCFGS